LVTCLKTLLSHGKAIKPFYGNDEFDELVMLDVYAPGAGQCMGYERLKNSMRVLMRRLLEQQEIFFWNTGEFWFIIL